MYQLTRISPEGDRHANNPVTAVRHVILEAGAFLVDIQTEPRKARRFALHLSRQSLGTAVEHKPSGWRFRIDQVEEKAADEATATPCST